MSALEFVSSLLERGVVRVSAPPDAPRDWRAAIVELDQMARPEMAFDPPPLVEPAAAWGLSMLYRSCQFLTYREVDAETVRRALAEPCPESARPAVCYSVDLALRYLPDVMSLTQGIASADPLVASLLGLASAWPLSSVGIKRVSNIDTGAFIIDRSLRQLYVDRIIERADVSRLDDSLVRDSVRAAVGSFAELAPAIAKSLTPVTAQHTAP
ncbi:MAG TPA: hypothetical protein VGI81_16840 [Tepidisphaeraceae bacterium]